MASVGLTAKVLDARAYAVIMFAIVATVLIAPLLVPVAFRASQADA